MSSLTKDLNPFFNRRAAVRFDFHSAIRFVRDPARRLKLGRGVSQDISVRGMQMLTTAVIDNKRPFEIWIPVGGTMIPAVAKAEWITVEDELGDSPYWVRTGISISFRRKSDRDFLLHALYKRSKPDRAAPGRSRSNHKVSYVF